MTKLIGFLGRKQSGKNTCSNIIHGLELRRLGMIENFKIDEDGNLLVLTSMTSTGEKDWGIFDVTRKDEQFVSWAHNQMWPYIKNYAFGDKLKMLCHELFDIPLELLFGTDAQKNTQIEYLLWENMPGVYTDPYASEQSGVFHDPGQMTVREVLQFMGTEVFRKIWEPVWINYLAKQIAEEKSEMPIITDVRFVNEAKAIKDAGGILIKLHRKPTKTKDAKHGSEAEVDTVPKNLIDYDIFNNKKGYTLNDLQCDVENIYDNIILS
jgi:hypothetical protein